MVPRDGEMNRGGSEMNRGGSEMNFTREDPNISADIELTGHCDITSIMGRTKNEEFIGKRMKLVSFILNDTSLRFIAKL